MNSSDPPNDDDTPAGGPMRQRWQSRFRRSQSLNYLRSLAASSRGLASFAAVLSQRAPARRAPRRVVAAVTPQSATVAPRLREVRVADDQIVSGGTVWRPRRLATLNTRSTTHRLRGRLTAQATRRRGGGLWSLFCDLLEADGWLQLFEDALMLGYGAAPMARWQVLSNPPRKQRKARVQPVDASHEPQHDEDEPEAPKPVYLEDESVLHAATRE